MGAANALSVAALCGEPLATAIDAGAPGVLVSAKLVVSEPEAATTLYKPAVELAVKATEAAIPEASVTALFWPPAKLPLAPEAGAANVMVTPLSGLPPASLTNTFKGLANAVFTCALCGD